MISPRSSRLARSRGLLSLPGITGLGLGVALVPAAVLAQPDVDPWTLSQSELEAIGLGQSRGEPVPVPAGTPRLRAPTEPRAHATPGVVFVNFDGAQLSPGADDAINNVTQLTQLAGAFAAYGEGTKRQAALQAVQVDWSAYDVFITDERPASGPYTMNMTGPTNPFGNGILGVAPLDCNDSQTNSNITYAFHSANDPFSAATQATTISQEVAHSYGLEHVNQPGDIMNPSNAGGDPSFLDECISIVPGQNGILCGAQHAVHCPQGGGAAQNAHLELLDMFGASVPDAAAPTVTITAPVDGDVFEVGASFDIEVSAADDTGIESVQLFNNGSALQSDGTEPYGWTVDNIPEGEYALFVVATDVAGNETTSATVTVFVGASPPAGSDETGGDSDEGSGGDDDDDDDDSGTGEFPAGLGDDDASTGCGCGAGASSGPFRSAPLALLGLLGLGVVRRRRDAAGR